MDKADRRVFPVGCRWNACSHHDEIFFMRNELVVPTNSAKLLEQFFPRWMRVLRSLQDLQYIIMCIPICYKRAKSIKGPVDISTAGTPTPKLKSKRNIMLRRTINQYTISFLIMRENLSLYLS
jgi:hypothetical protein